MNWGFVRICLLSPHHKHALVEWAIVHRVQVLLFTGFYFSPKKHSVSNMLYNIHWSDCLLIFQGSPLVLHFPAGILWYKMPTQVLWLFRNALKEKYIFNILNRKATLVPLPQGDYRVTTLMHHSVCIKAVPLFNTRQLEIRYSLTLRKLVNAHKIRFEVYHCKQSNSVWVLGHMAVHS